MIEIIPLNEVLPILAEVIRSGGEFYFMPRGTSMNPTIIEGRDGVYLIAPDNCKKHDIVLYKRYDGTYVLHRIAKVKKDSYTMLGDNQIVYEKNVPKSAVIAVVSKYERKGKTFARGTSEFNIDRMRSRIYIFFRTIYRGAKNFLIS